MSDTTEKAKTPAAGADPLNFKDESNILRFVRPSRWVSVDIAGYPMLRMNWVSSGLASLVLWTFVIWALSAGVNAAEEVKGWQAWITVNWTWLYIATQDVWFIFIIYLLFTKYKDVKLGRDDEKPAFSDYEWFSMLFACGIGVGLYTFGVAEPMWYYRMNYYNPQKIPIVNDDQRAQQAIFITLFHWGIHGWIPYVLVAITLGVICYRHGRPMTIRAAFYPLLGENVNGLIGDLIDALSISCTTFGVCTSLGLGVTTIATTIARLNSDVNPNSDTTKGLIIWIITGIACVSVVSGLKNGIRLLSKITFSIGLIFLFGLICVDDPMFLMNSFVQSIGHYLQWVTVVGWDCDAWPALTGGLLGNGKNGWVHDDGSWKSTAKGWAGYALGRSGEHNIIDSVNTVAGNPTQDFDAMWGKRTGFYFMDDWTIFYWGWWISWAPFVGMFIARISRGRTVGQLIKGAFIAPVLFGFFYLTILGSLGIKMQRIAEMAIGTSSSVDWSKGGGAVDCGAFGYSGSQLDPTTAGYAAGKALQDAGYYPLSCRNGPDHILDVVEPYGKLARPFQALILIAVSLYFITSSDSGSYVDDLISAMGYENPPVLQKVYWCFTEGALATALVYSGGLKMVQAVSIVAGFPYTLALNFMCLSLWRALLDEGGDEEYRRKRKSFNTCLFDFLEAFKPLDASTSAPGAKDRVLSALKNLIFPFQAIVKCKEAVGADKNVAVFNGALVTGLLWTFIGLLASTGAKANTHGVAWLMFFIFVFCVAGIRRELREKRNIIGGVMEDYTSVMALWPFALAQMEHEADADDKMA